ncbi:uncharacterized protein N7506_000214 [Penicillium brevicompactum]|uniref:uncharacterized protein n=1 Tax=Penicillium brevicompactum TaxID=5074 RepID=UPI0025407FC6|nr:uncharacterized protein N7506_000214 [Penicillium brevicompactum]KAJ5346961.1 hypothetical protein N7506_000214 [Penicillium brevicompactum]
MGTINEYNEAQVQGIMPDGMTPENRVFGKFFTNVDGCRHLMKQEQAIASGGAVLHALELNPTWKTADLDIFMSSRKLSKQGLLEWHQFLRSEGYLLSKRTETAYAGGRVRLTLQYQDIVLMKIVL